MSFKFITNLFCIVSLIFFGLVSPNLVKAEVVREIVFPVLGGAGYYNDFGMPRSGGRSHEGNDLSSKKMTPLLAATDGIISFITVNEPTWGWSLTIVDAEGYEYNYLHINNDTPGTDDGKGGYANAFAPNISLGSKVVAGQVVAYMGDSGNAETTAPHLHFEIREPNTKNPLNPFFSLEVAKILTEPVTNQNPQTGELPTNKPNPVEPVPPVSATTPAEIIPYEQFEGGANVAGANFDTQSDPEFVIGTAFGGGGRTIIKTYSTEGNLTTEFFAYGDIFRGGVDVTAGNTDGVGEDEIITAPGPGGGPHIKVFDTQGKVKSEFMAYSPNFRGGVRVASADIDGDGKAEIITAPGVGGGPHIKVFDTQGKVKSEFMAYSPNFRGGVDVSAYAGLDGISGGIVTAPGPGGGPHIKVFDPSLKLIGEFMAYEESFSGGVRVSSGNLVSGNGAFEVVTVPASNSSAKTQMFKTNGTFLDSSYLGFEKLWTGGMDVAVVGSEVYISSYGGRQTSVKKVNDLP